MGSSDSSLTGGVSTAFRINIILIDHIHMVAMVSYDITQVGRLYLSTVK